MRVRAPMPGDRVSWWRRFWRWLNKPAPEPERCVKCHCVLIQQKHLVRGQMRFVVCTGVDANGECLHMEMVMS